jgi:glycosyltransferase involved in cell wall biosynthesis
VRDQVNAKLLVLGEGEDRAALELLIKDLGLTGDVELPGVTPNAMAYMRRASVLASSSRWEGMPGVLIEALAVGTPVVATDCPTGPRDILEGDRYGELVAVGDPEALAHGIMRTLKGHPDSSTLMARGRSFSAERAAENYLALMEAS